MTSQRFTPALRQTTILPIFPPSASTDTSPAGERALNFTYVPSNGFAAGKTPEVWSNLPLATSTGAGEQPDQPQWHAVPFSPSPEAKGVFVARLPLAPDTEGSFEYTFRLRSTDSPDHVEWLGSEGSNGLVVIVRLDDAALSAAQEGLKTADGQGWRDLGEGLKVWKGAIPVDDGQKASLNWSAFVRGERWCDADAVVWEQTPRTWIQPRQLDPSSPLSSLSTSFPAQLLVLRSTPTKAHPLAQTLALLPFSTPGACSALYGDGSGGLDLRVERDADDGKELESHMALAWSSGAPGSPSLHALLATVGAAARSIKAGEALSAPKEDDLARAALNPPRDLGLCTWNGLSAEFDEPYTATSLLDWLDVLLDPSTSGSPLASAAVRTVLLDDGWQDTAPYVDFDGGDQAHSERRALRSFQCGHEWYDLDAESPEEEQGRADKAQAAKKHSLDSGFAASPPGRTREVGDPREGVCVELRDVVSRIKERGIDRVGVWLTLAGYWHGIHPDSALADAYTLRRVELRHAGLDNYNGHIFLPTAADLPQYFTDYFSSLAAAGIDFVKVDDQVLVDSIFKQEVGQDEEPGSVPDEPGTLRATMLSAMRAAAVDVFGVNGIIHCMASSPRHYGGVLQPGDTVRSSDDFFPNEVDSHRWHIAHNAFAALLVAQALGLEPDFDMIQSARACKFAGAHLPLRAFSTAQVYCTDPPPRTASDKGDDWDVLLATTKRGVRVLQARTPGVAGAVLDSSIGSNVLGRFDSPCEPLKVGLPVPSAKGAHIGRWDCAPLNEGSRDREMRGVLDEKDLADVLGPLGSTFGVGDELVLFSAQQASAVEVACAAVKDAEYQPRALAKPLASVVVTPTQPQVTTLARLFSLAPTSDAPTSGEIKVACLGLLGKTVGLAAIRSVGAGHGSIPAAKPAAQAGAASEAPASQAAPAALAPVAPPSPDSGPALPASQPTQQLSEQPAPARPHSPRSTLPLPQGRVSFLLAYFASAFFRAAPIDGPRRTPQSELADLAHDALRSPLRTLFGEMRALVSFGCAAVLWAVGAGQSRHVNGQARRAVTAGPEPASAPPEEEPMSRDVAKAYTGDTLRIELDYVGRLGLYVSLPARTSSPATEGGESSSLPLRLALDGASVDPLFIRSSLLDDSKGQRFLVEVDLEAAWNKSIGSRPAPEAEAERENAGSEPAAVGEEEVKPWVVEVQAV